MKILFIAPHPFFSLRGTPIAGRALLSALAQHGHSIDVLTYHEGEDPGIPGVRVVRIPAPPGVRNVPPGFSWRKCLCDAFLLAKAIPMVGRRRYDLIHAIEESAFIALLLRPWSRTPYVYDMDSMLVEQTVAKLEAARWVEPLLRRIEARMIRGSVGVIAVCRLLEEYAVRAAPETRVYRLEDTSLLEFANEAPDDLVALTGTQGPFILYVGNLEPIQGIDLLLPAVQKALERGHEAQLVIVGGREARIEQYRSMAEELRIAPNVHFIGPRPLKQLAGYLRQATVLASPRNGGMNTPMKIYSYLDSGRPLLATRLDTHTQVLDDEVSVLVRPDAEAMADGLVRLLTDAGLRERIGAAGKALAQREYTPNAFVEKSDRIFEEIERDIAARRR